jgi:hypothetical protein
LNFDSSYASNISFFELSNSSLDVTDATTLNSTLDVTCYTNLSNTLDVTSKITATGGLDISGDLLSTTNATQIPVTKSTFTVKNSGFTSLLGDSSNNWEAATEYNTSRLVLSGNSFIKIEFKVNFISSPEADQTLSFKVTKSVDGGTESDVFTDLGSNMGITFTNVYNGTFIDDLNGIENNSTVKYQLYYKRNYPDDDTISTNFGIVNGGNYIFLQELYQPLA